jgi:hypothetical protein
MTNLEAKVFNDFARYALPSSYKSTLFAMICSNWCEYGWRQREMLNTPPMLTLMRDDHILD